MSEGCLGPYSPILQPGDVQTFTFEEGDEGHFYLDLRMQEAKKYDSFTGKNKKAKPLTNADLREKLKGIGINIGKEKDRNWLNWLDIMGSHCFTENMREGWMGKATGMLQVAWEQGLVNPAQWSEYQVNTPSDAFGAKVKSPSLREILSPSEDFINEQS